MLAIAGPLVALLVAVLAVRQEKTWDKARHRPTAFGVGALALAVCAFGLSIYEIARRREVQDARLSYIYETVFGATYLFLDDTQDLITTNGREWKYDEKTVRLRLTEMLSSLEHHVVPVLGRHAHLLAPETEADLDDLLNLANQLRAELSLQALERASVLSEVCGRTSSAYRLNQTACSHLMDTWGAECAIAYFSWEDCDDLVEGIDDALSHAWEGARKAHDLLAKAWDQHTNESIDQTWQSALAELKQARSRSVHSKEREAELIAEGLEPSPLLSQYSLAIARAVRHLDEAISEASGDQGARQSRDRWCRIEEEVGAVYTAFCTDEPDAARACELAQIYEKHGGPCRWR